MIKQSNFFKKMNFCISRLIIVSIVLLTAVLYALVANKSSKSPLFSLSTANACGPNASFKRAVKVENTEELMSLFDQHDYSLETSTKGGCLKVPALYLSTLPNDFAQDLTIAEKKELFMKTLLPLILEANDEIIQERTQLITLKNILEAGGKLLEEQHTWLDNLAKKYRLKKFSSENQEKLNILLIRVDEIPVAMALGQAIEEAGWGRSYAARIKNATHGVTLPSGVKAYESLPTSVKAYMRNLNANPAYIKMRKIRADLRAQNKNLCGVKMMDGLYHYSELRNQYIRKVKKHITYHNLVRFEDAQLKEIQQLS